MNIYRLSVGYVAHYVAADDEAAAIQKGVQIPELSYMSFNVELVEVPGYYIIVADEKAESLPFMDPDHDLELPESPVIEHDEFEDLVPDMELVKAQVANMDREQLVQWLKENDIKHHHNLKDDKLRELILNHVE